MTINIWNKIFLFAVLFLVGCSGSSGPGSYDPSEDPSIHTAKELQFQKHCKDLKGSLTVDALSHTLCKVGNKTERE